MNEEVLRAFRRLIAVSDNSVTALRQVADLVGANDRPMAVMLLNVSDLLDGATQHATMTIAHQPTEGDRMQFEVILSQISAYPPPQSREPDGGS